MIGMRRDLIDKVGREMEGCRLFSKTASYPRRYFDDLIIEKTMEEVRLKAEEAESLQKMGAYDEAKLRESVTKVRQRPFNDLKTPKKKNIYATIQHCNHEQDSDEDSMPQFSQGR